MYFYLISKIKEEQHEHNEYIASLLDGEVFIPHKHNPYNIDHSDIEFSVFYTDLTAMLKADVGIVSLPIGKDCCGEVGWFSGMRKPVYAIVTCLEEYNSLKRDWMIKGFLTGAIAMTQEVEDAIIKDKILRVVKPDFMKGE